MEVAQLNEHANVRDIDNVKVNHIVKILIKTATLTLFKHTSIIIIFIIIHIQFQNSLIIINQNQITQSIIIYIYHNFLVF